MKHKQPQWVIDQKKSMLNYIDKSLKAKGKSRTWLAGEIGVTVGGVTRWLRYYNNISIEDLIKIKKVLHIKIFHRKK